MASVPVDLELTPEEIRTPRAAAIAGIAFAVLLTTALVLVHWSVPGDPSDAGGWLTNRSKRNAVVVALNLVPSRALRSCGLSA